MAMATPFGRLGPVEIALREAIEQAGDTPGAVIAVDASLQADRRLRGAYLAWVLTAAVRDRPGIIGLELSGGVIEGALNLGGARASLTPRFVACRFPGGITLKDAAIVGFELIGSEVLEIDGDRLSASGSLVMRGRVASDRSPIPADAAAVIHRQLRLNGAKIAGNLDLRRCRIAGEGAAIVVFADGLTVTGSALLSDRFKAAGEVRLNGGQFGRNLDFSGAGLRASDHYSLSFIEGHVSGSLYLCEAQDWPTYPEPARFYSIGTIQLSGTHVEGTLDCGGGWFCAPGLPPPRYPSPMNLDRSTIAIDANGITVDRALRLRNGFHVIGKVNLVNAKLGGDLQCHGAGFDLPGDTALAADGISVAGTTFFEKGARPRFDEKGETELTCRVAGFIGLNHADLKQGLYLSDLEFRAPPDIATRRAGRHRHDRPPNCGLQATFATIGGHLLFKAIGVQSPDAIVAIDLRYSKTGVLDDDRDSWSKVASALLTGFQYDTIHNLVPHEMWRCDLLEGRILPADPGPLRRAGAWLSYAVLPVLLLVRAAAVWALRCIGVTVPPRASVLGFEPLPFLWLAKIVQQAGYPAMARRILIRLEANRTRFGDIGSGELLWRFIILAGTVRYGYRPTHAIWVLLIWTAVSACLFAQAPRGQIIDTRLRCTMASGASGDACPDATQPGPDFRPAYFAFDTLIPIIDLGQKSRWEVVLPDADWYRSPARNIVPILALANKFIGWALGALFVAGLSGLLKAKIES
jgi:hypothetical protein